jgi:hypothetical protein
VDDVRHGRGAGRVFCAGANGGYGGVTVAINILHLRLPSIMNKEAPQQTFAIRLTAILLIAGGVSVIAHLIFNGFIILDLGFLGLFIGKGLLERKDLWRKWSVFILWCGTLGAIGGAIVLAFGSQYWTVEIAGIEYHPQHSTIQLMILMLAMLGIGVLCFWLQWVLTRPEVKATFSMAGEKNSWWLSIAAASLLIFCMMEYHDSMTRRLLKSIEHYEATIQAFDAKTNARLNPAIGLPSVGSKEIFPRTGVCATEDGMMVSGLGIEPIEVGVSVKGYQEKKIKLPFSHGHNTISVELDRKEGSEEKKDKPDDQDTEGK